jgi:hypothetical protein
MVFLKPLLVFQFEGKLREAQTDPHEGKRRTETLWPIFRIHHQRSRYVFDLHYKEEKISRELYEVVALIFSIDFCKEKISII